MASSKGFTLIECLIALGLLGLLAVGLIQHPLGERSWAWHTTTQLQSFIEVARAQAYHHQHPIVIQTETHPLSSYHEQRPLKTLTIPKHIQIQYLGFPDLHTLHINHQGQLDSNGRFTISARGKPYFQLILNAGGRMRIIEA